MYEEHFTAKRLYKTDIRKSKKAKQDQEIEQLRKTNDINAAWKYLKRNRGELISRKPDDHEMFTYYSHLLDGVMDQPEIALSIPVPVTEEHLIGVDELEDHISAMKMGKAEGPDGLKAEAIKNADTKYMEAMRTILNNCLKGLHFPVGWRNARIYPILKKGDPTVPAN